MKLIIATLLMVPYTISSIGCADGSDSAHALIGAAGGTVALEDGTTVTIPPGAVTSDLEVTISAVGGASPMPPTGRIWIGDTYEIGPTGTQFYLPVNVALAFKPTSVPANVTANQLEVFAAPGASDPFESLGMTTVDATHVAATTLHFSYFGATAPDGSPSCAGQLCPGATETSVDVNYACSGICSGQGSVRLVPAANADPTFTYGTNADPSSGGLSMFMTDSVGDSANLYLTGLPPPGTLPVAYSWCFAAPPPEAPKPIGAHIALGRVTLDLSCSGQMFKTTVLIGSTLDNSTPTCSATLCTECDAPDPNAQENTTASFGGAITCDETLTDRNADTTTAGTFCSFSGGFSFGGLANGVCR